MSCCHHSVSGGIFVVFVRLACVSRESVRWIFLKLCRNVPWGKHKFVVFRFSKFSFLNFCAGRPSVSPSVSLSHFHDNMITPKIFDAEARNLNSEGTWMISRTSSTFYDLDLLFKVTASFLCAKYRQIPSTPPITR